MNSTRPIAEYIQFLISRQNLSVTLHPLVSDTVLWDTDLLRFNIHNNAYCLYLKSCEAAQHHCISKQSRVFDRCRGGSFCGVCYAGVREYVYPISDGQRLVGFLSVSGYKAESPSSYLARTAERFQLPLDELQETYATLKDDLPAKDAVDVLLIPLCQMLQLFLMENPCRSSCHGGLAEKVLFYIRKNHNRPITARDICQTFGCSRTYLSTVFKKETGRTLRQTINDLRIDDAKTLLLYSELSVTQIAYSVGFDDSNYFTSVFKKTQGISPLQYRRQKSAKN